MIGLVLQFGVSRFSRILFALGALCGGLMCGGLMLPAQGMQSNDHNRNSPPPDGQVRGPDRGDRGPDHGPDRGLHLGPPGRWWDDPRMAKELNLSPDQQKRMDGVFVQSRMKLIDLMAALQKEELMLEPLLAADKPDGSRTLAQIDRVAQARADLEKANGHMLFGLREVLTVDQWSHLQSLGPPARGPGPPPGR